LCTKLHLIGPTAVCLDFFLRDGVDLSSNSITKYKPKYNLVCLNNKLLSCIYFYYVYYVSLLFLGGAKAKYLITSLDVLPLNCFNILEKVQLLNIYIIIIFIVII